MTTKIPATVVTGFLGAGKTSLIQHLLRTADGRRLALIINEFGDIGVDGEILKGCRDRGLRGRESDRARQWLHLLHRRGRLPADHGGAAQSPLAPGPYRDRDLRPGAAEALDQGLHLARGAHPRDRRRGHRRGRRPGRRGRAFAEDLDALAACAPPIPASITTARWPSSSRISWLAPIS
jgi:Putative GTPases (G3E family)